MTCSTWCPFSNLVCDGHFGTSFSLAGERCHVSNAAIFSPSMATYTSCNVAFVAQLCLSVPSCVLREGGREM